MSKKSSFTTVTPLPEGMTRQAAVAFLQDHVAMIDVNPLVIDRQRIPPPSHAQPDELPCTWYQVTDKISYLPGGLASGSVSYSCAFLDLAGVGLQTHCYAPMGVDLRTKWSIGGAAAGEARERTELGLDAPPTGLYLREDTELRCGLLMAGFVKKTLKDSHKRLVERLAREVQDRQNRERVLGVAAKGGRPGDEEADKPAAAAAAANAHRYSSSYYLQREAEAGRRAAAASTVEYQRNANHHHHYQQSKDLHYDASDDRQGMYDYAGGGNNNSSYGYQNQQPYHHAQPAPPHCYEAGVSHAASELP